MGLIQFLITVAVNVIIAVARSAVQKALAKKKKSDVGSLDASQQVQTNLGPDEPREIVFGYRLTGGVRAWIDSYGANLEDALDILVLQTVPSQGDIWEFYADGESLTLSGDPTAGWVTVTNLYQGRQGEDRLKLRLFTGQDNAAAGLGSYLASRFPSYFTSNSNFTECTVLLVEGKNTNDDYDPDTGDNYIPFQGFPAIKAATRFALVCDPRIPGADYNDTSTYVWSDNPALCEAQKDYGIYNGTGANKALVVGNGYGDALLNIDQIKANADYCEARGYVMAGRVRSGEPDDLEEIRKSYNAVRVETPALVFSVPEGLRDAPVIIDMAEYPAARITRANRYGFSTDVPNIMQTTYAEPSEQFTKKDLPIYAPQALLDEDGGIPRSRDLPLNFVPSGLAAHYLQKEEIAVERATAEVDIADLPPRFNSDNVLRVTGRVQIINSRIDWVNGMTFYVVSRSRSMDYDVGLTLREYPGDEAFEDDAVEPVIPTTPITPRVPIIPYIPGVQTALRNTVDNIIAGTQSLADVTIVGRGSLVGEQSAQETNINTALGGGGGGGGNVTITPSYAVGSGAVSTTQETNDITVSVTGGNWVEVFGNAAATLIDRGGGVYAFSGEITAGTPRRSTWRYDSLTAGTFDVNVTFSEG